MYLHDSLYIYTIDMILRQIHYTGSEDSPNSRNKEKSKNRIHQIKSLSHKSKNKKSKNETDEGK